MWGKHCSNSQYVFFEKTTKLNSQPAQYEKNKINKDNYEKKTKKNHKKGGKNHVWENTVAIHSVLKKKTTKLNFQPTSY